MMKKYLRYLPLIGVLCLLLCSTIGQTQDWESQLEGNGPWLVVFGKKTTKEAQFIQSGFGAAGGSIIDRYVDVNGGPYEEDKYENFNAAPEDPDGTTRRVRVTHTASRFKAELLFINCSTNLPHGNIANNDPGYDNTGTITEDVFLRSTGNYFRRNTTFSASGINNQIFYRSSSNRAVLVAEINSVLTQQNTNTPLVYEDNGQCSSYNNVGTDKQEVRVLAIIPYNGCDYNYKYNENGEYEGFFAACETIDNTCEDDCYRWRSSPSAPWTVMCVQVARAAPRGGQEDTRHSPEVRYNGDGTIDLRIKNPLTLSYYDLEKGMTKWPILQMNKRTGSCNNNDLWKSVPYYVKSDNGPQFAGGCVVESTGSADTESKKMTCTKCDPIEKFILSNAVGGVFKAVGSGLTTFGTVVLPGPTEVVNQGSTSANPFALLRATVGGTAYLFGLTSTYLGKGFGKVCLDATDPSFDRGVMNPGDIQNENSSVLDRFNLSSKDDVFVFPNPSIDKVNVSFFLAKTNPVNVSIISMSGRMIKSKSIGRLSTGHQTIEIATNSVPPGSYMLRIYLGSQGTHTQRIVKM